jgi:hypothetical protein
LQARSLRAILIGIEPSPDVDGCQKARIDGELAAAQQPTASGGLYMLHCKRPLSGALLPL